MLVAIIWFFTLIHSIENRAVMRDKSLVSTIHGTGTSHNNNNDNMKQIKVKVTPTIVKVRSPNFNLNQMQIESRILKSKYKELYTEKDANKINTLRSDDNQENERLNKYDKQSQETVWNVNESELDQIGYIRSNVTFIEQMQADLPNVDKLSEINDISTATHHRNMTESDKLYQEDLFKQNLDIDTDFILMNDAPQITVIDDISNADTEQDKLIEANMTSQINNINSYVNSDSKDVIDDEITKSILSLQKDLLQTGSVPNVSETVHIEVDIPTLTTENNNNNSDDVGDDDDDDDDDDNDDDDDDDKNFQVSNQNVTLVKHLKPKPTINNLKNIQFNRPVLRPKKN